MSIESQIREMRKPSLENLLRDVRERPGYYHSSKWWIMLNPKDPRHQWYMLIRQALRDRKIVRGWNGRFYLPEHSISLRETVTIYASVTLDTLWSMLVEARGFLTGLATAYVIFGVFFGVGMERKLPAMNAAGVAYYAATWPAFFAAGAYDTPSPPIPDWAFTFPTKG